MNVNDIRPGMSVKTVSELEPTTGFLIKQVYLDNRRPNTDGEVINYVGGHGGDVWWVRHSADVVAAYVYSELDPA